MTQKLSIAFIWHMHQPSYKNRETGEYLMPWVRLHAIKDYLDMLLILEKFPNIKQTFNLVPLLVDQIYDYGHNNAHDIHSRLTVTDIKDLTTEDRTFILQHFFDANYINMIAPHDPYRKLYEKRYKQEKLAIEGFSDQEYSDILAWFNLAWFDPCWFELKPELKNLYDKAQDYTLEDRKLIINIQRDIIRAIIPKYKELSEKGQIEISTSPYYHPVMPLIIDSNSAKRASNDIVLPENKFNCAQDIKEQITKSIEKFNDLFGKKPVGIWPSEHCISPETIELMADLGIKWTITDEGNLAKTIDKEFVRDFHGDLEDPYDLCKVYQANINDKKLFVLFRDSVIADLISFEYGGYSPEVAANDLYERIKNIQTKLQSAPKRKYIVTIALDGENSWESYQEDGRQFLLSLYTLLSNDETLNVTTVSDFVDKVKSPTVLKDIHSGSWINRNFDIWIGDPTKNLAWEYLYKTRQDLTQYISENKYSKEKIENAWKEIYVAESSDWFWWYGEPNDSGQDDLFDKLFRLHLQNVYKIFDKQVPDYLYVPLDVAIGKLSKNPSGLLKPVMNGKINSEDEWAQAGHIEIPQGPMYQFDKLVRKIFFGYDNDNIYFRFDINQTSLPKATNDVYIYFYSEDKFKDISPFRLKNKGSRIFPAQRYSYTHELEICLGQEVTPPVLAEAIESNLWKVKREHSIKYAYGSIFEIAIPFKDLDIQAGNEVNFVIGISKSQILYQIIPQDRVLSIIRPLGITDH